MLLTNPLGFGIRDLLEENAGHAGLKYVPMVGSISVLILLSNLLGVIPTFASPTAQVSVPLGCAIVTFLYFNWQGIRHHGAGGYLKHFAGPIWWLAPLMFPVEIISTCARILSLTVRLWANIFASDLLYVIFLGLLVQPVLWGMERSPAVGAVLGVFPGADSAGLRRPAYFCLHHPDVRFHPAAGDVHRLRHGRGALIRFRARGFVCHSERSEESLCGFLTETLCSPGIRVRAVYPEHSRRVLAARPEQMS